MSSFALLEGCTPALRSFWWRIGTTMIGFRYKVWPFMATYQEQAFQYKPDRNGSLRFKHWFMLYFGVLACFTGLLSELQWMAGLKAAKNHKSLICKKIFFLLIGKWAVPFFWRASVPLSVTSDEKSEPLRSGLVTMVRGFSQLPDKTLKFTFRDQRIKLKDQSRKTKA